VRVYVALSTTVVVAAADRIIPRGAAVGEAPVAPQAHTRPSRSVKLE
jgi:hypothetical protein